MPWPATGTTVLWEVQRQSATHRVRYQILPLSKYRSHARPMKDRHGSKKFYSNGSENSRFQVFRTDIFRKLTLGAPGSSRGTQRQFYHYYHYTIGIWAASISHTNSPMWPVFRRWLHARDSSHVLHYKVASLHKITSTESLAPSQLLCRVNSMRKTRNWSLNFHTHIREFKIIYRPKDMEIN